MSIIIKLTGGLGNQLFQYAHGRALSLQKKEPLYLDTSWYKGRIDRQYLLDNFNINAKKAGFRVKNISRRFLTLSARNLP